MPKVEFTQSEARQGAHPVTGEDLGAFRSADLSDAAGLTQIGVHVETLLPGAKSSMRHWHESEDEMVYVLSGELTLVEDAGETILRAGDAAAWPAGAPNAHRLENRSARDASFLTAGKRGPRDVIHYPDHDLVLTYDGPRETWTRGDGTPAGEG